MLKIYGQIYSNSKEDFDVLTNELRDNGFDIAYQSETNGTVVKEVASLAESENQSAGE